jgi:hypothetical protein
MNDEIATFHSAVEQKIKSIIKLGQNNQGTN